MMRFPSGVTDQYIYFVAVDATDLKTRETGLNSFTVYRSRNGGAAAAFTTPTVNETDTSNMPGVYELLLDEDMTIDSGDDSQAVCLHITHAGMAPVTLTYELYRPKATAGETLTVSSGVGSANTVQVSGDSTAADNLETAFDDTAGAVPWQGIIDQGTAQSATGTTLVLRSAAAFADDELIGATIVITGGSAGVGQRRLITDYVSSTDTATVDTWTTTPTGTITYKIYATAPSSGGSGLDAAGVRAALGMSSANLDTQLSTIDTVVDRIEVDTQDIQSRIPASLNNGCIAADVQRINDVEVVGAGTEGDKWRA